MQLVVPSAVRAAVMAATSTFNSTSQMFLLFIFDVLVEFVTSVNFDLRSRLLLLGIAQTSLALLSLNRSLLFRSLERGHSLFLSLPYQGLRRIPALPLPRRAEASRFPSVAASRRSLSTGRRS